jgi:hypothetical protein
MVFRENLSKSVKKNVLMLFTNMNRYTIRNHKLKCLWIHTDPDPQLLCECLSYLAHFALVPAIFIYAQI